MLKIKVGVKTLGKHLHGVVVQGAPGEIKVTVVFKDPKVGVEVDLEKEVAIEEEIVEASVVRVEMKAMMMVSEVAEEEIVMMVEVSEMVKEEKMVVVSEHGEIEKMVEAFEVAEANSIGITAMAKLTMIGGRTIMNALEIGAQNQVSKLIRGEVSNLNRK